MATSPLYSRLGATPMRKERLTEQVRALLDSATGERFVFSKDYFELGAASQLFAGRDPEGRERVFKRLSCEEPRSRRSERSRLRRRGQKAGNTGLHEAVKEVMFLREASPWLARDLRVLTTERNGEVSKVYLVMAPMRDDLLGCIRGLEAGSPRLREGVAREVMTQLVHHLLRMQRPNKEGLGLTHGDMRAENILLDRDEHGRPMVLPADFGLSKRVSPTCEFIRRDARFLARVVLQTLMPHRRTTVKDDPEGAIAECRNYYPLLVPAVVALQSGDLQGASRLLPPALDAVLRAEVDAFLAGRDQKVAEVSKAICAMDIELTSGLIPAEPSA